MKNTILNANKKFFDQARASSVRAWQVRRAVSETFNRALHCTLMKYIFLYLIWADHELTSQTKKPRL